MFLRRVVVPLICTLIAAFLPLSALAQPSTGKISGTVRDANGVADRGSARSRSRTRTPGPRGRRSIRDRRLRGGRSPAGPLHGVGRSAGLPEGDPEGPAARCRRDAHRRFRSRAEGRGGRHGHGHETRGDGEQDARSPSRRRPKKSCGSAASTNIEDVAANVAGFTVQNLGPGQSTVAMRGVSSGQIARDQPGVKESGRRLPRRIGHLSLALHAGHRSLRHEPRRGAARAAGNAVRLRLGSRARCATSATSPSSA